MAKSGKFSVSTDWVGGTAEIRWSTTTNSAANQSTVTIELWAHTSGFTTHGNGSWVLRIGNDATVTAAVDVAGTFEKIVSRSRTVTHGADGTLSIQIGVVSGEVAGTSWNSTSGLATVALDDFNRLPSAPLSLSVSDVTSTSMQWDWAAPTTAPGGVLEYRLRWSLSPTFASGVTTVSTGTTRSYDLTGRTPGVTHYVAVAARTGDGWGPWSATGSQTTLPAVAPGLAVAPSLDGRQAVLTYTPPGGVSGVTRYDWERRVAGTTSPVATAPGTATTVLVGGLTPGTTYEWRAMAWVGTYQSPWSEWLAVTQPKPNTIAGDYFDGDTDDVPAAGINYIWTGTAGSSISQATATVPVGWVAAPNGGSAVISRILGGISGQFAARVTMLADATAVGSRFGQAEVAPHTADVTEDASYHGSIYVRASRANRLAAEITWLNVSHGFISRSVGTAQVLAVDVWTRLTVFATSPAEAEFAYVRVVDVAGTGAVAWQGGDIIDLDGAMLNLGELYDYFDGDTTDTDVYDYDWVGTAHASASIRREIATSANEDDPVLVSVGARALIDPACPAPPAPPRPPTIPNPCIEESGQWRRFFGYIKAEDVPDWLTVVPTFEIETLTSTVRQARIRIYPNPDHLPAEQVNMTTWFSEQIVSYLPTHTTLILDGVTQRAYASVNGGSVISADHLLYGSKGTPPTWPTLSCGIDYLVSVDLPLEVPQGDSRIFAYLTTRT